MAQGLALRLSFAGSRRALGPWRILGPAARGYARGLRHRSAAGRDPHIQVMWCSKPCQGSNPAPRSQTDWGRRFGRSAPLAVTLVAGMAPGSSWGAFALGFLVLQIGAVPPQPALVQVLILIATFCSWRKDGAAPSPVPAPCSSAWSSPRGSPWAISPTSSTQRRTLSTRKASCPSCPRWGGAGQGFYSKLHFWSPQRNEIGHYLINLDTGEIERRCFEYGERLADLLPALRPRLPDQVPPRQHGGDPGREDQEQPGALQP
jgi:hypothetical protein